MSYSFVLGGHYYCHPDWSWLAKSMPDYDLWLVLGGAGTLTVSGTSYQITSGDCFVFHPGCHAMGSHDPEHPLEVIAIHFVPVNNSQAPTFPVHRKLKQTKFLVELMENAIKHDGSETEERADFWLTAALFHLDELDQESHNFEPPGVYDEIISELASDMEMAPEQSWSVAEMASRCHLSKDHFTKTFKGSIGITPLEFLIRARITRAKHDLLNSNLNINQIAERLGYTSVYFFSRQFKSKVGLSPRDYRRSFLG